MALRDLRERLEDDGLHYPGVVSRDHPDGKQYDVPSVDALTGAWLVATTEVARKAKAGGELTEADIKALVLDNDDEKSLYQKVLGPVYDEMITDGVSWNRIRMVGQDAFLCFAVSEQAANMALEVEVPKAPAQNRKDRRTQRAKGGSKSGRASTDTPALTPSPASTPSSTSPTEPEDAAQAVRAGPTSSSSGP